MVIAVRYNTLIIIIIAIIVKHFDKNSLNLLNVGLVWPCPLEKIKHML